MSERVTRSRTGKTPSKPSNPDFVETPTRRSNRTRKSVLPDGATPEPDAIDEYSNGDPKANRHSHVQANGQKSASPRVNGYTNGEAKAAKTPNKAVVQEDDSKWDNSGEFEFGGPAGVTALMIGFPALMYYMWIGATYYNGLPPMPSAGQNWGNFVQELGKLIYTGAFPTLKAWTIYWVFGIFQMVLYMVMPGVYSKGKPLKHLGGKKLDYYCNAFTTFYFNIAIALTLHFTGLFKLYTLLDEFGPLMSVAIISGFLVSIAAYVSAIWRGAEHRMSGYLFYDFFMGAELNPRMFYWLDFKMFFEIRLPWFILFFTTLGACARQYEQYGFVSGELCFLLMAHFLYANACAKGEELIPPTWDMYFEKWGFMLIFWNMAGVPLSYCHCTLYLANNPPETYRWNRLGLGFMFAAYLFAYWVWDTCGSQKNRFRAQARGDLFERNTFPQLPWKDIKNPKTIKTDTGDDLLVDGWYKYARKIHYTCDMWFALSWALITGFRSPFPWFYPVFFAAMIAHRAWRDDQKCRKKYGKAWEEFCRQTPYIFIPYVI